MSRKTKITFFLALVFALGLSSDAFLGKTNEASNDKPVIGVLTQPSEFEDLFPSSNYSYIATPYIEFVEASGARALPIRYDLSEEKLLQIFRGINGLLLPGGGSVLWDSNGPSKLMKTGSFLLNLAIQANKGGDYFPVWGTCMGYELLLLAINNNNETLSHFIDSENHSEGLSSINLNETKIFKAFTPDEINYMENEKPFFFYHKYGITPEKFNSFTKLTDFFKITSTSRTKNGTIFVSSIEAISYPIYGVQFHAEKIPYIWRNEINVSHTQEAIVIEQKIANFFNNEARKNFHFFCDSALLDSLLIYNYETKKVPTSFMTCYFFENNNSTSLAQA